MSRAVMQQALEALEWAWDGNALTGKEMVAIAALRAALAEPERQWVSLTEQEMYDLFFHDQYGPRLPEHLVNTIKCIEAALKEKNT